MNLSHLGLSALREVLNWHPIFVHLPLAFLPAALGFYTWAIVLHRPHALAIGRACLLLGVLGARAALLTGLRAEDSIPHDKTIHALMQTHKTVAWILAITSVGLASWTLWRGDGSPRRPRLFLLALMVANLLLLQTGDLGARLVYLHGAGVLSAQSPIPTEPHTELEARESHAHQHTE